jgi:chemotaxis protein CheD
MHARSRPDATGIGVLRAHTGQDLHLLAGQLWFGREAKSVRTLLGSCVAVTLWHPRQHVGGMCHFLLPHRKRSAGQPRDARFGDEALEMMVEMLGRMGTRPQDFEAHLYGGADTMPQQTGVKFNVGERNIEQGWSLIDRYGFTLQGVDVGENIPRNVSLDLTNGEVAMRRGHSVRKAA